MDKATFQQVFDSMPQLHVAVIGDVMLDNYWWGNVERMSPEGPVPVVALKKQESRLGGAANVALNCIALGAKVTLASVVGDDAEGKRLVQLAKDAGIDTQIIMHSSLRHTTTKTRVLSRNQQMMRLDNEVVDDLYTEEEHPFIDMALRFLQREKPGIVIFEDYNKGVLKENVVNRLIAHCKEIGIITAVDPKKKNFLSYKGVTIFKPNLKEIREGLHLSLAHANKDELDTAHQELHKTLNHAITFITLSERGVYVNDGNSSAIIPTHIRDIADVSGAGDTVIATAALIYTLTKDASLMAEVANIAGGLVCEEVGVVPINKKALEQESILLLGE